MKGLILKDLMCLRKQLILFAYVVIAVLVLSIMFVLSTRFGNLSLASQSMMAENGLTDLDIENLFVWVLMIFMVLPVASVGDITSVFIEDGKAGFMKVSAVMPFSIAKRVLAKFITMIMMFGIGVLVDLIISFVLSRLTALVSFADFFGIIISAASIMSIYGALVTLFCFLYGYGKEGYALVSTILLMISVAIMVNIQNIKNALGDMAGEAYTDPILNNFLNFFKHKFYILFVIAIVTMIISYFVSVYIADRKRGVI